MSEEQKTISADEYIEKVTNAVYAAHSKACASNADTNTQGLRDAFAQSALNALIMLTERVPTSRLLCEDAYKIADNMLEARK